MERRRARPGSYFVRRNTAAKKPSVPWRWGKSSRNVPLGSVIGAIVALVRAAPQNLAGGDRLQLRVSGGQSLDDTAVLGARHGAGRVDEAPTRGHEVEGALANGQLLNRQPVHIRRRQPPASLGIAPQRTDTSARRIDQHPVDRAAQALERRRPALFVQHHRLCVGHLGALRPALELGELALGDVAGDHPAAPAQGGGDGQRLASGARAIVDHQPARRRRHQLGDQLAALVLSFERAAAKRPQAEQVGAREHVQGVAGVAPRLGLDLLGGERGRQRLAVADQAVGAHRHRRPLIERLGQRLGFLGAEVGHQQRRQPVGQRPAQRDAPRHVALAAQCVVDASNCVPVDVGVTTRGVVGRQPGLEDQVGDQAQLVRGAAARAMTAGCQGLVDTAQVANHPVQGLGGETALATAQLAVGAERGGQVIGREAPVDSYALPQILHECPERVAIEERTRHFHVTHFLWRFVRDRH